MNELDAFANYLTHEKRFSAHTIGAYQADLMQFLIYLTADEANLKLSGASYLDVRGWVISLIDQGIAPKSVNRKIASLSHFYRFLQKAGKIELNPTERLQALKTPKSLPNFVQADELTTILDHSQFEQDYKGQRDKMVLELLYGTGMRLSELKNLKWSSVDLVQKQISVLGKRNKMRIIPLTSTLQQLLQQFKANFPQVSDWVIQTDKGKQAYPMLIYRIVKKYLGVAKSAEKKSPHVLRHSYATHLLENGADLNAIKDLLGHASLASTQIYTHNSLARLKEVFDKAHPKSGS